MNLKQIRQRVIDRSGRFDLVVDTTDYVDNGCDDYIQAGQRHLDLISEFKKSSGRVFQKISAGDHGIVFQQSRVIKEVWMMNNDSRLRLEKVPEEILRGVKPDIPPTYPSRADYVNYDAYVTAVNEFVQPFSKISQGRPYYYYPATLRLVPGPDDTAPGDMLDGYGNYFDVMATNSYSYNGIIFLPPADGEYVVEVRGKFFSNTLADDTDESAWSVEFPEILIMAAMREIEVFHRNRQGVADWDFALGIKLNELEMDVVEEEVEEITQMEG